MKITLRKTASFTFRWGIAVVGIWWVVSNMSIADHTLVLDSRDRPVEATIIEQMSPDRYRVKVESQGVREVTTADLVNAPDRKTVQIGPDKKKVSLLGMDLGGGNGQTVLRLLVADTPDGVGRWISPNEVADGFILSVPHPKIEVGLARMVREADPLLLILAVAIFPVTIIVTSVRWHKMLGALDIHLSLLRTVALNWVGQFYNTFIPMGSTGGDLLKAYYASTHTPYKTRAVMSVIVDRVIGLAVLIIMGGVIAAVYWAMSPNKMDPAVRACGYVGLMAGLIVGGMAAFLLVAYHPRLRSITRFEQILAKLPMQNQVQGAVEVMTIYRQRPGLMLWSMLVTFPVHITVVISALLAGKAFGLPISTGYYFIVVPVTVLAGAIPISPQGAGVMEFFAINLTARQGATISQAFALTMSIRAVQILWNLVGGIFVIGGQYRAHKPDVKLTDAQVPVAD